MEEQIFLAIGLQPGTYRLTIIIAFGSANTLHSHLPIHTAIPYENSFDYFMEELLPIADFVFGIGSRALGFNLAGWHQELLPLFKPGSRLFITRAGGTLPCIELDVSSLVRYTRIKLVELGVMKDEQTGKTGNASALLLLAIQLGPVAEFDSPNLSLPERALVNDAARSFVGRAVAGYGKLMMNAGGNAHRFPHRSSLFLPFVYLGDTNVSRDLDGAVLTVDEPLYGTDKFGNQVPVKAKGIRRNRPVVGVSFHSARIVNIPRVDC